MTKKILAVLMLCMLTLGLASTAFALQCEECSKSYTEYCNKKHHSYGTYIQCTRDAKNCDYRGDYYSNYYKCSNKHEKITGKHLHGIQHSYCGNSFTDCKLPKKS